MSIRVGDNIIAGGGVPINKSGMSIFDFKWTDHLLNSPSWLRADTFSWQDGTVYELAYQHLVDDINGKTLTSETIGTTTIQFYLADDGHKICPETEEANVGQIFLDTGVAWYYILDETNTKFKLPRTEHSVVGIRGNVGDYVEAGLPNITGSFSVTPYVNSKQQKSGAFTLGSYDAGSGTNGLSGGAYWAGNNIGGQTFNFSASESNPIYGASTTVQPSATQMYLYFYIGEFTQTATYNTAGITTEALNAKADLSMFQIVNALPANPDPNTIYFVISQ